MGEHCLSCDKVFEKKNKGCKRKSIDSNLPNSHRSILETTFCSPVKKRQGILFLFVTHAHPPV